MQSNFLALEPKFGDYHRSRFAVLPIPYDSTVSYQAGTRNGPDAIIAASAHVEEFDEELLFEPYKVGIATCKPVAANVDGPRAMHEDIYKAARKIVRDGKFLFALGGEHGITSGLVRAVADKYKKLSILQIDAHTDLRDSFHGSAYSHASVMRRCLDHCDHLVAVGIRAYSAEEYRFMKKAGITPIHARQCHESDEWIEQVLDSLNENVYVTIDVDGFDPAYAPGTGTPEPGGLDWYQVTGLLKLVAAEKKVVAADLVEVMPIPGQRTTEFLAARLAYRLMGYVAAVESGKL